MMLSLPLGRYWMDCSVGLWWAYGGPMVFLPVLAGHPFVAYCCNVLNAGWAVANPDGHMSPLYSLRFISIFGKGDLALVTLQGVVSGTVLFDCPISSSP